MPLFMLAGAVLTGCSLPRGPINFDPLVPRWLSHGEISCECPPEPAVLAESTTRGAPPGIDPPTSKFHPGPVHPVFEHRVAYQP